MGMCSLLMVVDWQLFLVAISQVKDGRGNAGYLVERRYSSVLPMQQCTLLATISETGYGLSRHAVGN